MLTEAVAVTGEGTIGVLRDVEVVIAMAAAQQRERFFSRKRIIEALSWRIGALYDRLPLRLRARVADVRARRHARHGISNFDQERLTKSYVSAWERLLREDPTAAEGDYLEFGVFYGSSLVCMHEAREQLGLMQAKLIGFDSFEGFPESADEEPGSTWFPGQCRSSIELARAYLRKHAVPENSVTLIKGWFSDTLTSATRERLGMRRASIMMVDCDLYSATREALRFAEPLIGPAAVIYFDDWNAAGIGDMGAGERRAFEEFLAENPDLRALELEGLDYKNKRDVKVFMVTREARGRGAQARP
jgi:hypothetical protein